MFVQATTSSRQNGKTYVSYLVRESFRTPKGPRSRTICNITDLPVPTRDLIIASLKGQDFLPADPVHLQEALDYGGLAVLNDAWSRFGLGELFSGLGSPRQRGLLQAVIYSRLLFPCAKLSLAQRAEGTWLAQACGLGARDTLRLEAGYLLYGQDMDESVNPYEAGLGRFVHLDKGGFVGREALIKLKEGARSRRLVGLALVGAGVARSGYSVLYQGRPVGRVPSGSYAPSLDISIALGYVPEGLSSPSTRLEVDVRGRSVEADVVPLPFYRRTRL